MSHAPSPLVDAQTGAAGRRDPAPAGRVASGLVSLSTSQPRIPLDRATAHFSRLRRMRRSTLTTAVEVEKRPVRPGFRAPRPTGVTLTYRPGTSWRARHVAQYCERVQKWAAQHGVEVPYVCVAELQERGAVHYHLVAWVPRHLSLPKPDKAGWWPHGSTRVETLRCGAAYASKYASKGEDGRSFPRGLRLHGRGGLSVAEKMVVRWWCLAKWVREHFPEAARDIRKVTGGYLSRSDGEFLASPWRVIREGGMLWAVRIQ